MTIGSFVAVVRVGFLSLLMFGVSAESSELKVSCVPALCPVLNEVVSQFERSTGHTPVTEFEFAPAAVRRIEAGETFDVVIVEPAAIDQLTRQGKAYTRTNLAYIGLGVGIRSGSSKPDIGSTAALKRALLDTRSIAYQPETGSGKYLLGLIERLGVAAELKGNLVPKACGSAIPSVANCEVDLVVISDSWNPGDARG
jgi:molybdate transport system substrate-binding protein